MIPDPNVEEICFQFKRHDEALDILFRGIVYTNTDHCLEFIVLSAILGNPHQERTQSRLNVCMYRCEEPPCRRLILYVVRLVVRVRGFLAYLRTVNSTDGHSRRRQRLERVLSQLFLFEICYNQKVITCALNVLLPNFAVPLWVRKPV